MHKALAALLLAGFVSSTAAYAAPMRAYDAVYELTSPTGKGSIHQMSDGKGHLRTESSQGGQKVVSIFDYPGKVCITLLETQKMYMKQPMTPVQADSADVDKLKKTAKDIGSKVIDSHPCHGYESKVGGSVTQSWIGDDIQNLVHSESTTPQGKTSMSLKSFSKNAPAGDLLAVPSGYKEMKMPGK